MTGKRKRDNVVSAFFTNWSSSDLPLHKKLKVFTRNRSVAIIKGCCGHHGEPGC